MKTPLLAAALCAAAVAAGADEAKTIDLPVYGKCTVVDTVDCTQTDHRFADYPAGASRVETILGKPCRVLDVQGGTASYLDWRLGEGKGLKPNGAYAVLIEYPDDVPRAYHVRNYGNNSRRSFHTGAAIGDAWPNWIAMSPLTSDVNDMSVAAFNPGFSTGVLYASAKTQYPEVLARLVDYMYSDEGAAMYYYGPMKGTDATLGIVDGWYYDENGRLTTDKVVSGEFTDISEYAYQYIKSYSSAPGRFDHYSQTYAEMAGVEFPGQVMTLYDQKTGDTISSVAMDKYTDDNNDGHWRITQSAALVDHLTAVRLPGVYLSAKQNQRVADLATVINDYVASESAKFIVGTRPLDEFDSYLTELRDLGIEEYISIYTEAYSTYIASLK